MNEVFIIPGVLFCKLSKKFFIYRAELTVHGNGTTGKSIRSCGHAIIKAALAAKIDLTDRSGEEIKMLHSGADIAEAFDVLCGGNCTVHRTVFL